MTVSQSRTIYNNTDSAYMYVHITGFIDECLKMILEGIRGIYSQSRYSRENSS